MQVWAVPLNGDNMNISNEKKKINPLNIFFNFIKSNFYYVLIFIGLIIIVISILEYIKYRKIKQIKETSILFYQSLEKVDLDTINSIKNLENIKLSDSGFSILASFKIPELSIKNKNYIQAYNEYYKIAQNNNIDQLYRDLAIVHAGFNLIDHIDQDRIKDLLNLIDIDRSDLRSHLYEIKFLNLIDDKNNNELNELSEFIQNDPEIHNSVKDRVKKINEFLFIK
tara:strand:- start:27175 stop:27849 length:675 start_codon:yes stop_codon:yes gene_type:complete